MSSHRFYPGVNLQFEVQDMRHTLIKHLSDHHGLLQEEVKKTIDNFPFEEVLQKEVTSAVNQMLSTAIRNAVESARFEVQKKLADVATSEILKALKKAYK